MKYFSSNSERASNMAVFRKNSCLYLAAALLPVLLLCSSLSRAAETVAILDFGKILIQSTAMKDAHDQIALMEEQYKKSQTIKESAFREEEQKLLQQRSILTPDAFSKKRDAFRDKARRFQSDVRLKLRQFALTRSSVVQQVETTLEPIVSKIAKSVKADMILEKKQILFAATEIEITDQIISDLNKKLPKIKVKLVALPKK
ncbi:MAG: OmpH family outer membrane protein [Sneathiella sp.]